MSSLFKRYSGKSLTNEVSENNSRGSLKDICYECHLKNVHKRDLLNKVRAELDKHHHHLII